MVRSLQSNVIYVLFSSKIVLTHADLQNNIELNNNLELLIAKLSEKNERFVLGGHSMGCVLALYTGYLMQYKPSIWNNCFIVGTAGAKWIPQNVSFYDLPNIQIFISGKLRHSKGNSTLLLDCFVNEGDVNLSVYKPFTVIYYDTENRDTFSLPFDNITYKITYPDKSSSLCKKLHMWSYYQELLSSINIKMNTDEQIKSDINNHKNLYQTVFAKKQEFTDAFKQGQVVGPNAYNTMSNYIDRVRVITNTNLSQIQDDNAILKKELDYFTKLANIQYNEPTERMTNIKQKINDEIIKLKASIKLRIKFMAIVLQTNSLVTSLQNITNKLRSSSLKLLALNTVLKTVKAKKMSESAKQITSDYERMIEETGAERSEEVGSYVMCNYKGNPDTQYLCEVIKINDNKYDVKYADGEVEQDVDKSNISQLPELINVLSKHVNNSVKARDSHGGKTRRIRTRTRK